MQTEISLSNNYRLDTIHKLKQLAEFHNPKKFKEMTRQNILEFLDRLRKSESVDPLHQWAGSYNITRTVLSKVCKDKPFGRLAGGLVSDVCI